jgi:hygromycin-B 4-O-kinase
MPEIKDEFDCRYQQLVKLTPFCADQKHLIHSDLLNKNLLVCNHKINAVIDWGCAMVGDPVYDLVVFNFFEPWYPAFAQTGLVAKMTESYLNLSPNNSKNFHQRIAACQIHLCLGNVAYCIFSNREKAASKLHLDRLSDLLESSK